MIIKSLARKQPTFRELVAYFHREDKPDGLPLTLRHNLWAEEHELDELVDEFESNHQCLPQRKNGNALYHEIISLPQGLKADRKQQERALIDLGQKYLSARAPEQLGYGVVHFERDHLHLHLMISSNAVGSRTRSRLSKAQFSEIQKDLEQYQCQKYPELGQDRYYGQDREPTQRRTREDQMHRRQRQPTQKMKAQEAIERNLSASAGHQEFKKSLEAEGWRLYCRAGTWGVEKSETGRRYRLKTLGQAENLAEAERRWALHHSRAEELRRIRDAQGRNREHKRER